MQKMMRKLILPAFLTACFLLVMQTASHAGPVPDGLAGVPWGATRAQVKKIMSENGFKQEDALPFSNEPSPNLVFYGSLANTMCYLEFKFKGNSFCHGRVVVIKLEDYQTVLAACNHFVSLLTDKYGMPDERESYESSSPGHPMMPYGVKWRLRDGASSDEYSIEAYTGDGSYWTVGTNTRRIIQFGLIYSAKSLENRLKEDGI